MRILIILFIFCLLPTASSEIRFEEVSHQVGITRIVKVGEMPGAILMEMDTLTYGLPTINTNQVSIATTVMGPSQTLLTRFGTRIRMRTHMAWHGQF